jgi:hypothetical protein
MQKNWGMTTIQWVILGVLALLGIGAVGGAGALAFTRSAAPALVATSAPFASPITASTAAHYPTLPPEWTSTTIPTATDTPPASATATPTDTPLPTATMRPSATAVPPTYTPRPTSRPVTQAPVAATGRQLLYRLNGNGSSNTQTLVIDNGIVELDWNYAGAPGGGTLSAADQNYHIQVLNSLQSSYSSDEAFYKQQEDDAARAGDALGFVRAQRAANARTSQYNNDVANENSRYQAAQVAAASGPDRSTFGLWGSASDGSGRWYVGGTTGPGSGVYGFNATGGVHFYFQVQAAGQWSLDIYWQPG